MDETKQLVVISEDMFAEGIPIEIFTEQDVNMDNVVEINTDTDTGEIVVVDDMAAISEVPEVVAAETVVTTTQTRPFPAIKSEGSSQLVAQLSGTSVLTTSGRYDMHCTHKPSAMSFVALSPEGQGDADTRNLSSRFKNDTTDPHIILKREKDRLKKKRLRADAAYRDKEKGEAKKRMQALRADPKYRQNERDLDRIRRRQARQRNTVTRKKLQKHTWREVIGDLNEDDSQSINYVQMQDISVKVRPQTDVQTKSIILTPGMKELKVERTPPSLTQPSVTITTVKNIAGQNVGYLWPHKAETGSTSQDALGSVNVGTIAVDPSSSRLLNPSDHSLGNYPETRILQTASKYSHVEQCESKETLLLEGSSDIKKEDLNIVRYTAT